MAKSCLNKLSGNITVGCTIPQVGVKNIYLMHAEDTTLSFEGAQVTAINFAQGSTVVLVEGYKQNIQITAATRALDASTRLGFSVMFKTIGRNTEDYLRLGTLLTGRFYCMAEYFDGSNTFIGAQSPLECSGMDWDSNANAGFTTVTLSTPEGSAGNNPMRATSIVYNSIKSKVGA